MFRPDRWTPVLALGAVAALAVTFAACEDGASDDLTGTTTADADRSSIGESAQSAARGTPTEVFTAKLRPLNGDVSHRPVTGKATVRVRDGRFTVRVNAKGLEPGIPHPQHIHGKAELVAGSCPDMSDDENGDGVVDVIEGLPDYGAIRLTLDGDLTDGPGTQVSSLPNPDNEGGAITYSASASLDAVQSGLDDAFGGFELALEKRHIVLHGVDPDTELSEAQSVGDLPAWLTLPVACGELAPASGPTARP